MRYIFDGAMGLPEFLQLIKDYDKKDDEVKKQIIEKVASHYGAINFTTNITFPFFRARNINTNQQIDSYQDILWPTNNDKLSNRFGNNMFYLASSMYTALAEIANPKQDRVALSVFIAKPDTNLTMLPIGELRQIINGIHGHYLTKEDTAYLESTFNTAMGVDEDMTLSYLLHDYFIAKQLLSENPNISSYTLSKILENTSLDFDIIGYPSQKSSGYNFCVKQDTFHDKFEIAWASKLKVQHLYNGLYKTYTKACLKEIVDCKLNWQSLEIYKDNAFISLNRRFIELNQSWLKSSK